MKQEIIVDSNRLVSSLTFILNMLDKFAISYTCTLKVVSNKLYVSAFSSLYFIASINILEEVEDCEFSFSITKSVRLLSGKGETMIIFNEHTVIFKQESGSINFRVVTSKASETDKTEISKYKIDCTFLNTASGLIRSFMSLGKIINQNVPVLFTEDSIQIRYSTIWVEFKAKLNIDTSLPYSSASVVLDFIKNESTLTIIETEKTFKLKTVEGRFLIIPNKPNTLESFEDTIKNKKKVNSINLTGLSHIIHEIMMVDKKILLSIIIYEDGVSLHYNTSEVSYHRNLGDCSKSSIIDLKYPADFANILFKATGDVFDLYLLEHLICFSNNRIRVVLSQ